MVTCELRRRPEWGSYDATGIEQLVEELHVKDDIIELGLVPYPFLHHVYKRCDIYVTPSYVESFGHPLVEAMACGLPIVASDLPVHREICGGAALYFHRFSHEKLADRVVEIALSPELGQKLRRRGGQRWPYFSWEKHLEDLFGLAKTLVEGPLGTKRQDSLE